MPQRLIPAAHLHREGEIGAAKAVQRRVHQSLVEVQNQSLALAAPCLPACEGIYLTYRCGGPLGRTLPECNLGTRHTGVGRSITIAAH